MSKSFRSGQRGEREFLGSRGDYGDGRYARGRGRGEGGFSRGRGDGSFSRGRGDGSFSRGRGDGNFSRGRGSGGNRYSMECGYAENVYLVSGKRYGENVRQEILDIPPGKISLSSNQFMINLPKTSVLVYQNKVTIKDGRNESLFVSEEERREVLQSVLAEKNWKSYEMLAYDGSENLISTTPITMPSTVHKVRQFSYMVEVSYLGVSVDLSKILKDPNHHNGLQFIDIIINWAVQRRANYAKRKVFVPKDYDPQDLVELGGNRNLCLLLGHSQSAFNFAVCKLASPVSKYSFGNCFQVEQKPYLSLAINPALELCILRQPLLNYCRKALNVDLLNPFIDKDTQNMLSVVNNLKVETHYIPDAKTGLPSKRTFKINSIVFEENAQTYAFEYKGESIHLDKYFELRYSVILQHKKAPLVQMKPAKKKIYVPVELVEVSYQRKNVANDEQVKTAMCQALLMDPGKRTNYVAKKRRTLDANPVLDFYKISLEEKPMVCTGLVLAPPLVKYSNGTKKPCKGQWNMEGRSFIKPSTIQQLVIVAFKTGMIRETNVQMFLSEFLKVASMVGLKGSMRPEVIWTNLGNLEAVKKSLVPKKPCPGFILFILPRQDTDYYSTIKNVFAGSIPTGCVVAPQTPLINENKRMSVGHFANILSKLNQKLGGVNHIIEYGPGSPTGMFATDTSFGLLAFCTNNTNPEGSTGMKVSPRVCVLLMSKMGSIHEFTHEAWLDLPTDTHVKGLDKHVKTVLTNAFESPKQWPQRLVLFREGVPSTRIEDVVLPEVHVIKNCYKSEAAHEPLIVAFAVYRVHGIRFFNALSSSPATSNIPPGTTVFESSIVPGMLPNFFLVPHAGIKGTSRCPRYYIVFDEMSSKKKLDLMFWIRFCYEQCHIYQICQRAVSYVTPLYYCQKYVNRILLHSKANLISLKSEIERQQAMVTQSNSDEIQENILEKSTGVVCTINQRIDTINKESTPMFYV